MAGSFEATLANIPGLGGYLAKGRYDQQQTLGDLQQLQGLQGLAQGPLKQQLLELQARKAQQDLDLQSQITQGGLGDLTDPDKMRQVGMRLALGGHPGGAAMIAEAERINERKRMRDVDAAELASMRGAPVQRSAIPAVGSQAEIDAALLEAWKKQGGGSVEAVPPGQEVRPSLPPRYEGGDFSVLFQSETPGVAARARQLQEQVNSGTITGANARKALDNLVRMEAAAAEKRTLAGNQAQLRRDLFDAAQANRPTSPLVAVMKKDGTGIELVPREEAVGRTPAATDPETQAAIAAAKGKAKLAAALPQARLRTDSIVQNLDRLDAAMTELDTDPGLTRITGTIAGRTPNVTNTATGAQAKLNSIKSQIFQSSLQAMREASKTGGAVGNVSDKEGDKLERTLAALDQAQGTPDFKKQLAKAIEQVRLSKALIKRAFEEQYGDVSGGGDGAWKDI